MFGIEVTAVREGMWRDDMTRLVGCLGGVFSARVCLSIQIITIDTIELKLNPTTSYYDCAARTRGHAPPTIPLALTDFPPPALHHTPPNTLTPAATTINPPNTDTMLGVTGVCDSARASRRASGW